MPRSWRAADRGCQAMGPRLRFHSGRSRTATCAPSMRAQPERGAPPGVPDEALREVPRRIEYRFRYNPLPGVDEAVPARRRAPDAAAAASVDAISERVSAGSITSSSSNSVAALSAFAFSSAAAVSSRTRCSRSSSSSIASSSLRSAEPHRALEAHRAEVRRRPRDGEQRLVQAAGDHRLRAEAVAAAQDHRDERHAQRGAGDEQPRGVAHEAGRLGLRARPSSRACRRARRSAGRTRRTAA